MSQPFVDVVGGENPSKLAKEDVAQWLEAKYGTKADKMEDEDVIQLSEF